MFFMKLSITMDQYPDLLFKKDNHKVLNSNVFLIKLKLQEKQLI